jgi:hypothetical protein
MISAIGSCQQVIFHDIFGGPAVTVSPTTTDTAAPAASGPIWEDPANASLAERITYVVRHLVEATGGPISEATRNAWRELLHPGSETTDVPDLDVARIKAPTTVSQALSVLGFQAPVIDYDVLAAAIVKAQAAAAAAAVPPPAPAVDAAAVATDGAAAA